MKQFWNSNKALSITELLIVVTVIGLLAVISTANFKKAQVASEVSEATKLLRYTSIALEAYNVDHGIFPYDGYVGSGGPGLEGHSYWCIGISMTTPIAYLPNKKLVDPFRRNIQLPDDSDYKNIRYANVGSSWNTDYSLYTGRVSISSYYDDMLNGIGAWQLISAGPDQTVGAYGWDMGTGYPTSSVFLPYDPTNGIISSGDILRSQKYSKGYYNVH
jgi:type II secretory pathway pseudopilin PulG